MTPSEVLKFIRYELRLSQEKLAHEIQASQKTISAWECGDREPSYPMRKKIEEFIKKHKLKVTIL